MTMEFKIVDGSGTLVPVSEEAYLKQLDQLSQIIEQLNTEPQIEKAIKEVSEILDKDALFVRGWDLLGELLEESGEGEGALQAYLNGYQAVLKILPAEFNGPFSISSEEVQCFLRFHNAYIDSLLAEKNYSEALIALQRQLTMDPHDMFELGESLGDLNILAGQLEAAEAILTKQVEYSPASYFSLGYIAYKRQQYSQAVSFLRRAFIMAPYVGMFLSGQSPIPNIFWENGAPDYSVEINYVGMLGGELWSEDELEHSFIYWLSQTSVILMEKASMVGLSEQCFTAASKDIPQDIETKFAALLAGITEETSAALVAELTDPVTGEKSLPWKVLLDYHHRLAAEDCESEDCESEDCGEDCNCGSC